MPPAWSERWLLGIAAGMDGEALVPAARRACARRTGHLTGFVREGSFVTGLGSEIIDPVLSCTVAAAYYGQRLVSDDKYGQHRIEWKMTPWIGNRSYPGGLWPVGAAVTDVINAL